MVIGFKKRTRLQEIIKIKKGIASEYLPWLLIAIAVLAIVMVTIFLLKGEGFSFIEKIKGLFGP